MKVIVAGDFCPRYRVADLLKENKFCNVLSDMKDIVTNADYSIVNFECPIVEDEDELISKCGPNLRSTAKAIDAIQYAGFSCATLANNHIGDYGSDAVNRTIRLLHANGLDTVGAGKNIRDASMVLYKEIKGEKIAIINCCEHEFSIATDSRAGANPLDPIQQFYRIQEARQKADFVFVIVHGGHELHQLPSPRMQALYRFFVDVGADAVVNGHQHCYSGYEFYKGKPIVYGLGNLCFDNPKKIHDIWNEGYMAEINFSDSDISLKLHPYIQCDEIPRVHLLKNRDEFEKKIEELNSIIFSKEALLEATENYYRSTENKFLVIHEPYSNRWMKFLYSRHLLPSFVSKKRMLKLLNFIECESQRDRHIYAIKRYLNL